MGRKTPHPSQSQGAAPDTSTASSVDQNTAHSDDVKKKIVPRLVPAGSETDPNAGFELPVELGRGKSSGIHDPRCSRHQCSVKIIDESSRTASVTINGVNVSQVISMRDGTKKLIGSGSTETLYPGDVLELLPGLQPSFRLVWPVPAAPQIQSEEKKQVFTVTSSSSHEASVSGVNAASKDVEALPSSSSISDLSNSIMSSSAAGSLANAHKSHDQHPGSVTEEEQSAQPLSQGSFISAQAYAATNNSTPSAAAATTAAATTTNAVNVNADDEMDDDVPLPFRLPTGMSVLCMPLLGVGMLMMDINDAASIAVSATREFLTSCKAANARVIFSLEKEEVRSIVNSLFGDEEERDSRLMIVDTPIETLFGNYTHKMIEAHDLPEEQRDAQARVYHALDSTWRWKLINNPEIARKDCCFNSQLSSGSSMQGQVTVETQIRHMLNMHTGSLAQIHGVELPLIPDGKVTAPLLLCVSPNSGNEHKADYIADPATARAALVQMYHNLFDVFRRIVTFAATGTKVLL